MGVRLSYHWARCNGLSERFIKPTKAGFTLRQQQQLPFRTFFSVKNRWHGPKIKKKDFFSPFASRFGGLVWRFGTGLACAVIGISFGRFVFQFQQRNVALAASTKQDGDDDDDEDVKKRRPLTSREKRFLRFASVEFDHQIYMTPRDFLDSVTQENPRQPKSGFRIAFNMFDMDGNQRVDKHEFLVIQALTLMLRKGGKIASFEEYLDSQGKSERSAFVKVLDLFRNSRKKLGRSLEDIWGKKKNQDVVQEHKEPLKMMYSSEEKSVWDKQSKMVEELQTQETTLLRHFFGPKGEWVLTYEDFEGFSENLQTEILEIEFNEFSKGKSTISETEFAKILLRYTVVHSDDYRAYLDRVRERIPEEKGVSFDQFRQFCQFLNNLDDFSIAMKLYTYADLPVSQAEFGRAVKVSTGFALDAHVIDTVFQVFDVNNDGRLSYSEFIAVMKDRIHRGFRSHLLRSDDWMSAWKGCVREEMKNY